MVILELETNTSGGCNKKKAPIGYTFSRAKTCPVGAFLGARQEMLCRRFCTQWVRAYPLGTLSLNMVGLLNRYYTLNPKFLFKMMKISGINPKFLLKMMIILFKMSNNIRDNHEKSV